MFGRGVLVGVGAFGLWGRVGNLWCVVVGVRIFGWMIIVVVWEVFGWWLWWGGWNGEGRVGIFGEWLWFGWEYFGGCDDDVIYKRFNPLWLVVVRGQVVLVVGVG